MKQNANPTIYSIEKKEWGKKDPNALLIGTPSLRRLQLRNDILVPSSLPSAEERSVYLALSKMSLQNTAASTTNAVSKHDHPLDILQQATDMSFPDVMSEKSMSHPLLQLSLSETKEEDEDSSAMTPRHNDLVEPFEIFEIIRNIQDPEHPLTLEQLNVVNLHHIVVVDHRDGNMDCDEDSNGNNVNSTEDKVLLCPHVDVRFTPTIPHCSMAMLIGLCIRVKLLRSLPTRFKVTVRITPGTHASELAVNKQLADKERVRAAIENVHLVGVVNRCIGNGMIGDGSEVG